MQINSTLESPQDLGEPCDDPVLVELDDAVRAEESLFAPMGSEDQDEEPEQPKPSCAVELIEPLAKRLLSKNSAHPDDRVPVLFIQGLSLIPEYKSLGGAVKVEYTIRLVGIPARTLSCVPNKEMRQIANFSQKLQFGFTAGGGAEIPKQALEIINTVPGLTLDGVRLGFTQDAHLQIAAEIPFQALEVLASPLEGGGAHWKLYRKSKDLMGFQALIHTALVPRDLKTFRAVVETSIVRIPLFGKERRWPQPPKTYEVPLESLNFLKGH